MIRSDMQNLVFLAEWSPRFDKRGRLPEVFRLGFLQILDEAR